MADEMLLAGFSLRDPAASRAFVHRFKHAVFGAALAVIVDSGLAEDIAQECFVRAWRNADQYDPCRGTVRSWLITIARNLAVDTLRVRRPQPVDDQDLALLIGVVTTTPEDQAVAQDPSSVLRVALADLPSVQARAVVMTAVHGLTAAEIAVVEQIPLGTAKSRIRAALTTMHATFVEGRER